MTGVRRRVTRAGSLLLVAACAQMDPPPGGPEDRTPPYLVAQQPDSLAVVPEFDRPVEIRFSERISEQQVEQSVMVSPRTSPVLVDRGSRGIRVSMREGWEPGQIYHVTVLPLIQDLFNNRLREPVEVVFSTGPEIPETRLGGLVRDRINGEPEAEVRVEAIRQVDSLVYAVQTDSLGRFVFSRVPEGDYLIRAYPDQNRNRSVDPFEPRDSASSPIGVADSGVVQLSLVLPDSTPPAAASATVSGARRVDVRFDDYLDAAQAVGPANVALVGPDGEAVEVGSVTVGEPVTTDPAAADTLAPADTAAADTLAPADTAANAAVAGDTPVSAGAPGDTLAAGAPADSLLAAGADLRLPSQLLVILLAEGAELTPEAEYTVRVTGLRNVVGLIGESEATFTAPEPPQPPEPADSPAPGATPDTVPPAEPVPER